MPPLYYSDPDREPRECPECNGLGHIGNACTVDECYECDGAGRLGVEGAEPDVEVFRRLDAMTADFLQVGEHGWWWTRLRLDGVPYGAEHGPYPNPQEALAAARKPK